MIRLGLLFCLPPDVSVADVVKAIEGRGTGRFTEKTVKDAVSSALDILYKEQENPK